MVVKRVLQNNSKIKRTAGEKSLSNAFRAKKNSKKRTVKREVNSVLRSTGLSYQRLSKKRNNILKEIEKAVQEKNTKKFSEANRKLGLINSQINKLESVQKKALKLVKEL